MSAPARSDTPLAAAPRRWSARAMATAGALLAAALGLAGWLLLSPQPPAGAARQLTRASLYETPVSGQPAAGREVQLPDAWDASVPVRGGTAIYRLALPDDTLRSQQSAVFIRRVGDVFRLSINGHGLVAIGEIREPLPDFSHEPVLIPLPQALLVEHGNELRIEVTGDARREPGLSTVWVGPHAELEPLYQAAMNAQVRSAWFVTAAAAAMGVLALLLAWRVRQAPYAWFGIASLLWAWRVTALLNSDAGAWTGLLHWSFQASYVGFVVLMTLYALAVVGRDSLRVRRALLGWSLLALGLTTLGLACGWPWLRTLVLFGNLLLAVWLLVQLMGAAVRERTTPALLLAACAAVCVVVGARDFYVFRVLHDYDAYTWARYTIVLLMGVLAWMLVNDFARSADALRELNRSLRDGIAAKERELAAAFDHTREHEREQATLAERDRILREMHDGLGGRLVAALALTQRVTPMEPAEAMRELRLALDDCLTELRLALDSLETEDQPVVEALAEMRFRVEPSLRAAGIRVVWQVDEAASEVTLPAAATLHVLRIAREAFTNVIKHARADTVWLRLEHRVDEAGPRLYLNVVDNGAQAVEGDNAAREPLKVSGGGRGLANMQRRAGSLQAGIDVGPQEQGWGVRLAIPLERAAPA